MKLEGEIGEINLIEHLVELWREKFTGAIRFENDGVIKIIYFKGGDVLSASTNDRADSIDEILMRAGKVSRDHVKQALAKRKESETLGDALLNLGFITRKELTWARRVQVIGVIRSIQAWNGGVFLVVADYLPKREEGTLFSLPQLIVEMVVTEQDRQRFERALEGGSVVYAKTPDFDEVFRSLGLNEDAEAIVREIDGERSAVEVALGSGRDTFNVYKLLHALSLLGILGRVETAATPAATVVPTPVPTDDFSFEGAGVSDASDLWNESSATPAIQIDEEEARSAPTLEIPTMSMDEPATTPAHSAWDDEEETVTTAVPAPPPMPAWNEPPHKPAPEPVAEEQWGFDEAQIETARSGGAPKVKTSTSETRRPVTSAFAPRPKRRSYAGLIIALLLVAVLVGAYFAYMWWQGRQDQAAVPVVTHRPLKRPVPPPAETGTVAPVTETVTTSPATGLTIASSPTQTSTTTAVTASMPAPNTSPSVAAAAPSRPPAPPKKPAAGAAAATQTAPPSTVQISRTAAGGAVITNTDAALPKVTARTQSGGGNDRARYDAMASEFAASATGNFTIQFEIVCEPSNITKALRAGGTNVWFVPISLKGGRSCYRVFWGHYTTRDEASRAMAQIPGSLRETAPAVVTVPRR